MRQGKEKGKRKEKWAFVWCSRLDAWWTDSTAKHPGKRNSHWIQKKNKSCTWESHFTPFLFPRLVNSLKSPQYWHMRTVVCPVCTCRTWGDGSDDQQSINQSITTNGESGGAHFLTIIWNWAIFKRPARWPAERVWNKVSAENGWKDSHRLRFYNFWTEKDHPRNPTRHVVQITQSAMWIRLGWQR